MIRSTTDEATDTALIPLADACTLFACRPVKSTLHRWAWMGFTTPHGRVKLEVWHVAGKRYTNRRAIQAFRARLAEFKGWDPTARKRCTQGSRRSEAAGGPGASLDFAAFRNATEALILHAAERAGWRLRRRVESDESQSVYLYLRHKLTPIDLDIRIANHDHPTGAGWGRCQRRLEIRHDRPAAGLGAICRRLHKAQKDAAGESAGGEGDERNGGAAGPSAASDRPAEASKKKGATRP